MPGPIDWPVNLAAQRIADGFSERVAKEGKGVDGETKPGAILLSQFASRVTNDYFGRMLDHWLAFRQMERQPGVEKARGLVVELRKARVLNSADVLELFKLLLGITILRPILSSKEGLSSSMYYASIHHPLLDETTCASIMDSVVIPAGKGTAGDALQTWLPVHSPVSFGERRGVVEWQDLVLGQVSMLVVAYRFQNPRPQGCSQFVVSAFLPLPGVFDTDDCRCGFSELLDDSVKSVGEDVVCSLCDAQLSFRESAHARSVSARSHSVAEARGPTESLVGNVAQMLVPSSFVELPTPVLAVGVAFPLDDSRNKYRLVHLALDNTASKSVLRRLVEPMLVRRIRQGVPAAKERTLRDNLEARYAFDDSCGVLFRPQGGGEPYALWAILTRDKQGWPKDVHEHLSGIAPVLDRLHRMVTFLTPLNPQFEEVGSTLTSAGVPSAWRHRYAVYKLRQNVLASFFDLLSRVLCCSNTDESTKLANQLEYILGVVLECPWDMGANDSRDLAKQVRTALSEIRTSVYRDLSDVLLGTSFYILSPGHVKLKHPSDLKGEERMICDLIQVASLGDFQIVDDGRSESCLDEIDLQVFRKHQWRGIEKQHDPDRAALLCAHDHDTLLLPLTYSIEAESYCSVELARNSDGAGNLASLLAKELASLVPADLTLRRMRAHLWTDTGMRFRSEKTEEWGPRLLLAHRPDEQAFLQYEQSRIAPIANLLRDSVSASEAEQQRKRNRDIERENLHLARIKAEANALSTIIMKSVVSQINKLQVALEPGRLFDNEFLVNLFPRQDQNVWEQPKIVGYHNSRTEKENRLLLSLGIHFMFGEAPTGPEENILSAARTLVAERVRTRDALKALLLDILNGTPQGFDTFKALCRPAYVAGSEVPLYALAVRLLIHPNVSDDFRIIVNSSRGDVELTPRNFNEQVGTLYKSPVFKQFNGHHADWMRSFVLLIGELQPARGAVYVPKMRVSANEIECDITGPPQEIATLRQMFDNNPESSELDDHGYRGACKEFKLARRRLNGKLVVAFDSTIKVTLK